MRLFFSSFKGKLKVKFVTKEKCNDDDDDVDDDEMSPKKYIYSLEKKHEK